MRLLLLVLAAPVLFGQEPPPKFGRILGKAVNSVTNEAVRKATIQLLASGRFVEGVAAETDNDGAFLLDNVLPGSYYLSGQKSGFVRTSYRSGGPSATNGLITVTAGGEVKDIVLKIDPAAILTGRIVDEDGEPLQNASITWLRRTHLDGAFRWARNGFHPGTDDHGEFRIGSLQPGPIRLFVEMRKTEPNKPIGTLQIGQEDFAYPRTFYPGVLNLDQAESIVLKPGQEFSVHIAMKRTRVYRIRGKYPAAVGEGGKGPVRIEISDKNASLYEPLMRDSTAQIANPQNGAFELSNIRPGHYRIQARDYRQGRPFAAGSAEVVVGNEDVEGLVIPFQPPAILSGKITMEPDAQTPPDGNPVDLQSLQIQLAPLGMGTNFLPDGAVVGKDGSFKIEGITPEKYRINVLGLTGHIFMKSILQGGREIKHLPVDLSGGSASLEVVLSHRFAKLSGNVEKMKSSAAAGLVVLEKVDTPFGMLGAMSPIAVMPTGSFHVENIAPGEYRVYAFEEIEFLQARDADFLKKFTFKASTLTLAESDSKTIALKQIPFAEVEAASTEQ